MTEKLKCKDCKDCQDQNTDYGLGTCLLLKKTVHLNKECENPYVKQKRDEDRK